MSYSNSFVEEIITSYNDVWDLYCQIPTVEDVCENYIDKKLAYAIEYIAGRYFSCEQYEEGNRILMENKLSEHDLVLFGLESCISAQSFDDLKITINYLLEDLGISYVDDETRLYHNLAQFKLW